MLGFTRENRKIRRAIAKIKAFLLEKLENNSLICFVNKYMASLIILKLD